ncbi:Ff.00g092200.m01.CDS01 [Fusarium sp. VM40]|nr:Ff.00g092200.m01.CDS01 [Fusarium sp. VM40]
MAPIQLRNDNSGYNTEQNLFAGIIALSCILFIVIVWLAMMFSRERKLALQALLLEQVAGETYTKYSVQKARFEAELLHAKEELEQSKDSAAELQKKVDELEEKEKVKVKAAKDAKLAVCDICGAIRRYMKSSPRQSKTDATSTRPFQATVMSAPTSPLWAPVSRD